MKKLFSFVAVTILSLSMMAAVGPQTILSTFNGSDAEGWQASSGGAISSVADGVANVTMALQNNSKYRADLQNQVAGTFTIDKTRDIVWAIKLTAPLPGTANSRKFEFQYKDADNADKWVNGINGPSGQIDCADGGRIYYFNLGNDGLNKLNALQDGNITVNKVHFIFADAVVEDQADAHYAVDWAATFTSVDALNDFANWNDEQQATTATLPYLELCMLPNANGESYAIRRNGFSDIELEGNYHVSLFAIEYFLIPDFSIAKQYTLTLETTGGGGYNALAAWDFPYEVTANDAAADMITKATAVTGVIPGSDDNTAAISPIASANCEANFWTLNLPANRLTPLATIGDKTLVGLLLTSADLVNNSSAKFASAANTEHAQPALVESGIDTDIIILNSTQQRAENSLEEAVANANDGDLITLYGDVTIADNRLTITKNLTIKGATGEEKILCGVPANQLMVLANGNDADYTVTFRDLIIDGQNEIRAIQLFDTNAKAKMAFDGVSVINTSYSVVTGDVKCNGSNIILSGVNSFPTGIYLNRDKRIDHQAATHTDPIRIILAGDYREDYAIVLHCTDTDLYNAVDADDVTDWELYVSNNELKGHKVEREATAIDQQMVNGKCPNGKFIKDGQLIIVRDGIEFNAIGVKL